MLYIYPEVEIMRGKDYIALRTNLVKKVKGKFYYSYFREQTYIGSDISIKERENKIIEIFNKFHRKIYYDIILNKIKEVDAVNGMYELAKEQISEKKRLSKLLGIKKDLPEKNKKRRIAGIKGRILDEYRKHKDLDWAEIAAIKIYDTYFKKLYK